MNNPIVLINNNQIIFRSDINIVDAGTGIELPLEHRLSKIGLIIPLSMRALSIFNVNGMMLNNTTVNTGLIEYLSEDTLKHQVLLLIDKFGQFYLISKFTLTPFRFTMNPVPHYDGCKFAITSNEIQNDMCYSAIENSDTIEAAFDVICNVEPITSRYKYRSYRISELVPWIATCVETKIPLPFAGYSEPVLKD